MSSQISNVNISNWEKFPADLWGEVFSYLDVSTVIKMTHVCKKFYQIVNNSNKLLWQKLALRNFNSIHITKEMMLKDASFLPEFIKAKGKLRCVQALEAQSSIVSVICFHKGNLITGTRGKSVRYWKNDGERWDSVDRVKLKEKVGSLFCVENKLFVGSDDGIVNLFDLSGYSQNEKKEFLINQHTFFPFVKSDDQPNMMGVNTLFFEDHHLFCASTSGMKIYENKANHWEKPLKIDCPEVLTTFCYKNGTLYLGNDLGEISIYKKEDAKWIQNGSFDAHDNCPIDTMSYDGVSLMSIGEDGFIKYWKQGSPWSITTTLSNGNIEQSQQESWQCTRSLQVKSCYPTNVIIFKDIYILTQSQDTYIHVYNGEGSDFTSTSCTETNDGVITCFSYNLGQIFSCTNQGVVSVWEVDNAPNQSQKKLKTHS